MKTYNELLAEALHELKTKVMGMPENADAEMLREMAEHDISHQAELIANFKDVWLWIWERKKTCECRNLSFLLCALRCGACCQAFRASPSKVETFVRDDQRVQSWIGEQINKLTGALALAEEDGDELRANIIALMLNNLEEQRKGKIRY